jgi:hypothetical protein
MQQKTLAHEQQLLIIQTMLQCSKANKNNSVKTAQCSQQPSAKPFFKV